MATQRLRVDLLLNSESFNKGLKTAEGRLKAFGSKMTSVGKSLSLRITAPMVLAGGQSIRMASKFDKSMTQIKTLVGVAGSEVDSMGQKVKQLASTTGVNAAEAAEALFFVTSAGLRGSEAMDVLEQSLKASALGLGETKTVADLATSAMNAYGSDTLGASDATDVLVSAVREGKLQADELSSVMGAVLPIASNMGVKFHEVGGAFAAMSRTGTPAAQAATQLNAILMAIMKPSEDAKKAMDELSLSQEGLRKQIREEGLLSVFELLRQKSEENSGAFERVFGNVRALKGILDLTGASADATRQIMERMANATGITSDAYKELTKSSSFQLNKALNELNVLFTEVGAVLLTTLLPVFKTVGTFVKNLTITFNNLSPEVKKAGVVIAGIVTALPPLVLGLGLVATAFGKVTAAVRILTLAMVKNPLTALAVGITALATASIEALHQLNPMVSRVTTLMNVIKSLGNPLKFGELQMLSSAKAAKIQSETTEDLTDKTDELSDSLKKLLTLQNQPSGTRRKTSGLNTSLKPMGLMNTGPIKINPIDLQPVIQGGQKLSKSAIEMMVNANNIINEGFVNMTMSMAEGLGFALATGGNVAEDMFNIMLSGIAMVMAELGRMMVTMGAAMIKFNAAMKALSGPTMVIAGLLLIAAAGAIKGVMAKKSQGVASFAKGGIVSGPTLAMVGDNTGAGRGNPEVIAPLNKLKGMIDDRANQQINVGGQFRVEGQDLVLALQRADRERNRIN